MGNESYYQGNQQYSRYLEGQQEKVFQKYADVVTKLAGPNGKILDVGCGTGIALKLMGDSRAYGIDISDSSVKIARGKGYPAEVYNGKKMPYAEASFDVVGSYNVLEHVDSPGSFLSESARLVAPNGYLVVVCPNFYSITNSYHARTRGIINKIKNISKLVSLLMKPSTEFETMPVTASGGDLAIVPDSDACNATNPLTIINVCENLGFSVVSWSCQSEYRHKIFKVIDATFLRVMFGSSFIVFQKN